MVDTGKSCPDTLNLTARDKVTLRALLARVSVLLDRMPDDRTCRTCTHYHDGKCGAHGQDIPPDRRDQDFGCPDRQDGYGTLFG